MEPGAHCLAGTSGPDMTGEYIEIRDSTPPWPPIDFGKGAWRLTWCGPGGGVELTIVTAGRETTYTFSESEARRLANEILAALEGIKS